MATSSYENGKFQGFLRSFRLYRLNTERSSESSGKTWTINGVMTPDTKAAPSWPLAGTNVPDGQGVARVAGLGIAIIVVGWQTTPAGVVDIWWWTCCDRLAACGLPWQEMHMRVAPNF